MSAPDLARVVQCAFPLARAHRIEPLAGGMRNSNFKLVIDSSPDPILLRIYEHDPTICRKELDLLVLLRDSLPLPRIIHAEPDGIEGVPPFMLQEFIEGITFRELRRTGDPQAIVEAASSVGEALAIVGRTAFPGGGWIGPGPRVTAPLLPGNDPLPRFVDLCFDSPLLATRMPADLRDRIHEAIWAAAAQLSALDRDPCLVHGDFNRRNVLVRSCDGRWSVVAILDWEFAVAGSPLIDIGNFLRYEPRSQPLVEPHFTDAFVSAGGILPPDWQHLSRLLDLAALIEILTHPELTDDLVQELIALIQLTVQ